MRQDAAGRPGDAVLRRGGRRPRPARGAAARPAGDPAGPDRRLGRQGADFDRRFRPTSDRSRQRWEAGARRAGSGSTCRRSTSTSWATSTSSATAITASRSPARRARPMMEAYVTEIDTVIDTEGIGGRRDLEGKNWGLRFLKRVPLDRRATGEHQLHRPVGLPPPRRDGGGVGLPADARRGRVLRQADDGDALVRRGVHPGGRDDRRGRRTRSRRDRRGRLHPGRQGALPVDPRARLEPGRAADGRPEERPEEGLSPTAGESA